MEFFPSGLRVDRDREHALKSYPKCTLIKQLTFFNHPVYENYFIKAFFLGIAECCILTSDPAKHAIPKTVEVTYSVGQLWEEIA